MLRYPVVRMRHAGLRPSDAFLVSYPRSGTTWLRFLLTHVLTGRPAAFDPVDQPVPYIGEQGRAPALLPENGRLIFSHEVIGVGDRRVIYVVRDPHAVALSEFRWLERRGLAPASLDRFIAEFVRGRSNPWGSWGHHVVAWTQRESAREDRLHLVRFEDLKTETANVLADTVRFLGIDPPPELIREAVADNTFERMRQKEEEAPDRAFAKGVERQLPFVRVGSTGGWRNVLTDEHRVEIERAFGAAARLAGY
jgi:hypothetical protein